MSRVFALLIALAAIHCTNQGTTWAAQTSGTGNSLLGVWGTSDSNIWAVGDAGTALHKIP